MFHVRDNDSVYGSRLAFDSVVICRHYRRYISSATYCQNSNIIGIWNSNGFRNAKHECPCANSSCNASLYFAVFQYAIYY